jgi:ABC-type antimicrobial peptide transport system permease subunit
MPNSRFDRPRGERGLERALGGSPLSVIVKLIFLSLIVGAIMAFLGLTPTSLFRAIGNFVTSILDLGTDAIWQVLQWVVAGALVVIPVWLLIRLLGRR